MHACMHVWAHVHVSVCGGEREWGGRAEAVFTSIFQSLQVAMAVFHSTLQIIWCQGLKDSYSNTCQAFLKHERYLWQYSTAHFRSFGVRGLKDIYSNTCQAFLKPERYLSQYMYLPCCFRASDISTPALSHLYQKLKKDLQQYTYEPLSEPFIVWRMTTASPAGLFSEPQGWQQHHLPAFFRASRVTTASLTSLF